MPNDNINHERFPPLDPSELDGAHEFTNIERVVVTKNGVYGLAVGGGWIRFVPINEIKGSQKR